MELSYAGVDVGFPHHTLVPSASSLLRWYRLESMDSDGLENRASFQQK